MRPLLNRLLCDPLKVFARIQIHFNWTIAPFNGIAMILKVLNSCNLLFDPSGLILLSLVLCFE